MRDDQPKINDDGTIIWRRGIADESQVVRYQDGVMETLTDTAREVGGLAIGNDGSVMWAEVFTSTDFQLFRYDDGVITQVTDNGLNNQGIRINSDGDFVWQRTDFDADPSWRSTIMYSISGEVLELTDGTTQVRGPDVDDAGRVVWENGETIHVWTDGDVETIPGTDDSVLPRLNQAGDIFFIRWIVDHWAAHLYRDETIFEMTDGPEEVGSGEINESGEIAIFMGVLPELDIRLVWRVRARGDFTGDGRIDPFDLESMHNCMSNRDCGTDTPPVCFDIFDFDEDGDIDFHDFGAFQIAATLDGGEE